MTYFHRTRNRIQQRHARDLELLDGHLLSSLRRPDLPQRLAEILTHAPEEPGDPAFGWSYMNRLLGLEHGSRRAATWETWRKFGRKPRRGAKRFLFAGPSPHCILPPRPRYGDTSAWVGPTRPAYAYDYSETEGPAIESCERVRPHLDLAPLSAPTLFDNRPVPTEPGMELVSPADPELFRNAHTRTSLVNRLFWNRRSDLDAASRRLMDELATAVILEALGTPCPCREAVLAAALHRHSLAHRLRLGSSAALLLELSMTGLELLFNPISLPGSGYAMELM